MPKVATAILADRTLKIGHRRPRGGAPVNPFYEVTLREVSSAPARSRSLS